MPLALQPVFAGLRHKSGDFPVAKRVAREGLSLPMSPQISECRFQRVVAATE